jgi:DNA polymerase (family X)
MPTNAEAAELLRQIADLLDVLGERFKPEAYRRAARSIDSLTEDLAKVAARDELGTIPGVGEAIQEKLKEYLATGRLPYLERLRTEVPAGLVEIMRLPGLGPKTARRFWTELGIKSRPELSDAIAAGRLDALKGFGPRKIELIRAAVGAAATPGGPARLPIDAAYPIAQRIVRALRERSKLDQVEVAGSFRRRRESVGDLDILVTSSEPEKVFDAFSALPEIREVQQRGTTKETVFLKSGLQVDLRVVEPEAFGAALVYFTGSKDHNVHLRTIARDMGLKVNEYGVTRGEERVGGRTEEEVYATLKLAMIPPEIRENRGEIEAAARGPLPPLVAESDLRGDLHVHVPESASPSEIGHLFAEARQRRYAYLGVVVAGVGPEGKSWSLPASALPHAKDPAARGPRLLRCVEIGPDGSSPDPLPPDLDYAIVRPTSPGPPKGELPEDPPVRLIAHLSGGTEGESPIPRRWIETAHRVGAAIEVGPGTERFDSNWSRLALESKVRLFVPTGLGASEDDPCLPIAIGFARRAGARPSDVSNTDDEVPTGRRRPKSGR